MERAQSPVDQTNWALPTVPVSDLANATIAFVQRVKQALKDNEGVYREFIRVMLAFKAGSFSIPELVAKIGVVFIHRRDLFLGFIAFLPTNYKSTIQTVLPESEFFSEVFKFIKSIKAQDKKLVQIFKNIVINLHRGNNSSEDFRNKIADLWKNHPALMKEFVHFLPKNLSECCSVRNPSKEQPNNNAKSIMRKYLEKPIFQLDLSKCEQCTPSYRLIPADYPLPAVGSRSSKAHAVLNDKWVATTSGREDYPSNHKPLNKYKEVLRTYEEDRHELDVLIESASYTIRGLEGLLDALHKQGEVVVGNQMTAIQLRHIERIYGDNGLEIVDLLSQNPALGIPKVLDRVNQKKNEWLKYREDMNEIWEEVVAKNYHKSLKNYNNQEDKDL